MRLGRLHIKLSFWTEHLWKFIAVLDLATRKSLKGILVKPEQFVVLAILALHSACESDLIMLLVKTGKEHGNFYTQNASGKSLCSWFILKNDQKLHIFKKRESPKCVHVLVFGIFV